MKNPSISDSCKDSSSPDAKGTARPFHNKGVAQFKSRLELIIGGDSLRKFSLKCGLSEGTLRKYLKGETFPTLDRLDLLAQAGDVDIEWLATGKGLMRPSILEQLNRLGVADEHEDMPEGGDYYHDYMSGIVEAETPDELVDCLSPSIKWVFQSKNVDLSGMWISWLASLAGRHCLDWDELNQLAELMQKKGGLGDEFALIPGYNIEVAAGIGSFPSGEEFTRKLAFRHKWLRFRGLKPENLVLVFAKGDSMEPTINDNNTLMIDTSNRELIDGHIYVIRTDGHLIVKRIQKLWNKGILLLSDNKEYREQQIEPNEADDLEVIGKVVWIGKDL